jgi:hypothetical protein
MLRRKKENFNVKKKEKASMLGRERAWTRRERKVR